MKKNHSSSPPKKFRKKLLPFVFAAMIAQNVHANDALEKMLDEGKVQEVIAAIKASADERPLTEREKLLYGSALIDAGQAKQGVKIVNAYVEANQQDPRAKLELARGLYLAGNLEEAKTAFEQVKASNNTLPDNVKNNISRFEAMISSRQSEMVFKFRPYVELGIGNDSNVNSGVGQPNVTLPFFGPVQISDSGQAQKSSYKRAQVGLGVSRPLDWDWSFNTNVAVDARWHTQASDFDSVNATVSTGVAYNKDADNFKASINYNNSRVDNNPVRYVPSVSLDYTRQFLGFSFNAGAQLGEQRNAGTQSIRDLRYTNATVGLRYQLPFASSMSPAISAQITRSNEKNKSTRPDLAKNSETARISAEFSPMSKLTLYTAASNTRSKYNEEDLFYALTRHDKQKGYEIGLQYALTPSWQISANASKTSVQSNIELYTNRRTTFDLGVRYNY